MKRIVLRIISLVLVSVFLFESNSLTVKAIADAASVENISLEDEYIQAIEDEESGTDYSSLEEDVPVEEALVIGMDSKIRSFTTWRSTLGYGTSWRFWTHKCRARREHFWRIR